MRNAKLWSLLLASVLVCGCVFGAMFIGADAAGTFELNVGGAAEYATVQEALDSVADADLSAYDSITVYVNADVTETFEGDLLFGQKTIWKEMGEMMPIIITGEGTLKLPVGTSSAPRKIANANDITFRDMTVNMREFYVQLFAGSGKLEFDGCSLGSGKNFNYRIYADNYTASVFEGWDEADYNAMADEDGHLNTSVTMKNGSYPTNSYYSIAAVGSSTDFEANIGSLKISANNTKTEVNWENVSTTYFYLRSGTNPVAKSTMNITDCTVSHGYRAAGFASDKADTPETYIGDMEININGGTYKNYGRLLHTCKLLADTSADKVDGVGEGNLTVNIKNAVYDDSTNGVAKNYIQTCYSGCIIEGDFNVTYENLEFYRGYVNNGNGGAVMGDYVCNVKNVVSNTFYGGFGAVYGSVTNNIENLDVTMQATGKSAVLDGIKLFQGSTVGNAEKYTGDHPETVGNIYNNIKDCTFAGGASYSEYKNTTSITYATLGAYAEGVVAGDIYNKLDNVTVDFNQIRVVGGNYQGVVNGNVNTEILGGSYYEFIGSEGSLVKGNINNTIKGAVTLKDAFYGAGYYEGTVLVVEGKVVNKILKGANGEEPTFLANSTKFSFYGGGHHTPIGGGVENVIEAGVFENIVQCGPFRIEPDTALGADANGYSIINHISGGTFKSYFYGGIASYQEPDAEKGETLGTFAGGIYNEISGGTFSGNRVALGNRFATLGENSPIVNKITGGTFNCPVYLASGGYGTSNAGAVAKATSTIEGGIFNGVVVAGNYGNTAVADCTLSVLGGSFGGDFVVGSTNNTMYDVNFTITQTAGKTLKIFGEAIFVDAFTFNGQVIEIGKNTEIYTTVAIGTDAVFHQTEGWEGHDYFFTEEFDESLEFTITEADTVYGIYNVMTNCIEGGYRLSAATLIFDERVGIRVLLDPEMVAIYGADFKYSVAKNGETAFMQGTELEKWTDPASGTTYDSFVIRGIGLNDFGSIFTVSVSGAYNQEFSIYGLAEKASDVWTGDWKTFADAIVNLHDVYRYGEAHNEAEKALLAVEQTLTYTREETAVSSASITVLMNDAVGFELNLGLAEGYAAGLTVKVNGFTVENALTVDGQTATAKLIFAARFMTEEFTLEVVDESGLTIFTMTTSLEKLVSTLAEDANNASQENAQALLYYVQKAAKVA